MMTTFTCAASHTHGVFLLFSFWSPSPATSSAMLCAGVLPHHPSTLSWCGWTQPMASSSLLSQHDSSPFLQLCVRCFQACFSHSCWLSQPKLPKQISLQGTLPCTSPGEGLLGLRTPWIPQLWADSCSQCNKLYLKVTSWEEPAALAGFTFSLSGWHKPYHYPMQFLPLRPWKNKIFLLSPSVYVL